MKKIMSAIVLLTLSLSAYAVDPLKNLPETVKNFHLQNSPGCEADLPSEAEAHRLGNQTLYIVPCILAAYNSMARAYIWDESWGDDPKMVSPVLVLTYQGGVVATEEIMGAYFDPATQTLSTFMKGRGIGDCGESSTIQFFVDEEWGSVSHYTTEIRNKYECDGVFDDEWPVVFSQEIKNPF